MDGRDYNSDKLEHLLTLCSALRSVQLVVDIQPFFLFAFRGFCFLPLLVIGALSVASVLGCYCLLLEKTRIDLVPQLMLPVYVLQVRDMEVPDGGQSTDERSDAPGGSGVYEAAA